MKRISLVVLLTLGLASLAYAQEAAPSPSPAPKPAMSKAQSQRMLIATEKKLWEAWKNKDVKPFQATLTADSVVVGDMGVMDKASLVKELPGINCELRSYTLSDFKVIFPSSNVAVVTYKGVQDGTCEGQALPATVWASSTYVRRGNKWFGAAHQETAAK